MAAVGMKRKFDNYIDQTTTNTGSTSNSNFYNDPTLIEDIDNDDEQEMVSYENLEETTTNEKEEEGNTTPTHPLIYFDQGNTPPRTSSTKKVKRQPMNFSKQQNSSKINDQKRIRSFNCNFKVTKGLFSNVTFTLKNRGDKCKKMEEQLANILKHPSIKSDNATTIGNNDISLEVKDFASDESLALYKDLQTNQFFDFIPQFEISGRDEQSRYIMCYLKGMLVRKTEMAIVPIPYHDHQILIFDHAQEQCYSDSTSCSQNGFLPEDFEFDTKLSCIIVPKYIMVLDLDETLIRTRQPNKNETKTNLQPYEFEFKVFGLTYICCVRPGTQNLLQWCCNLFKVYIFTNSVYEYAKEVVKILDPQRQHLLRNINLDDDNQLKQILKSREDMTPHESIPKPLGLKDLRKFNIDSFETVIFDDDLSIWKQQECVLPFNEIVQYKKPLEFFKTIRCEVWKKLTYLHNYKLKLRKKHEPMKKKNEDFKILLPDRPAITFSQEHAMFSNGFSPNFDSNNTSNNNI
ncbi:hypothetical protein ABK040_016760 [Willaertia magna]